MRSRRFTAALTAILFTTALGACDDPFAPDEVVEPGSLSLSYSGEAASGTFAAQGAPVFLSPTSADFGTWAVGGAARRHPGEKLLAIAYDGENEREGVLAAISFRAGSAPATIPIKANCGPECSSFALIFGTDPRENEGDIYRRCFLTSGTLQLMVLEEDRAAGTFAGEGWCLSFPGAVWSEFSVEEGSFDVDVVESYQPPIDL